MAYRVRYGWVKGLVQRQHTLIGFDHDPNPPLNLEDIPSGGATEELAATSTGSSTSAGALTRLRGLAATGTASGGDSAALSEIDALQAVSVGGSVSDGGLSLQTVGLQGASIGQSSDMPNLTVTPAVPPPPVVEQSPSAPGGRVHFDELRTVVTTHTTLPVRDDEEAMAYALALLL